MATPTSLPATFVAGNILTAAQMNALRGAFRVLQVVSTTKTDTFSMTGATFTDVTGLTASITPQATSSKILIIASVNCSQSVGLNNGFLRLARGGTAIGVGGTDGSRTPAGFEINAPSGTQATMATLTFLDSPSTTSATTYSVQIAANGAGANPIYVNRSSTYTNSAGYATLSSTITVMEISA